MEEPNTDIIIIKGAPASGKSQTAKELSKYFPKGVRMEIDTLRSMVISVNWTNQEEHINLLHLSTKVVNDFIQLGYSPVIIIDTFSGDKILKYIENLHQLNNNLTIRIFTLFITEDELKQRIEARINGEFRDFTICKNINEDVQKMRHNYEYQINTTGLLASETSKIIYDQIM